MAEVLAALGGLIPIVGALWVSSRALVRHAQSKRDFEKLRDLVDEHERNLRAVYRSEPIYPMPDFYSNQIRSVEFWHEKKLKEAGFTSLSTSAITARGNMDNPPLSRAQVADQWILIGSATAGIICLASSWLVALLSYYAASA